MKNSGLFIRDLLYIEQANKDYKEDGSINLPKMILLGDVFLMMKSLLVGELDINPDHRLIRGICSQKTYDDIEAHRLSLALES